MRYISHLDLLRLFQRAAQRAGLPIASSNGFSKRHLISIKRALKLGVESRDEEAEFKLKGDYDAALFKDKLQAQLPVGIDILKAEVMG